MEGDRKAGDMKQGKEAGREGGIEEGSKEGLRGGGKEGGKDGRKEEKKKTYINFVHAALVLYKSQQWFYAVQQTCSAACLQNEAILGHKHAALTAKKTDQELLVDLCRTIFLYCRTLWE